MQMGHIIGFKAGRVPCISHLGFEDDLVIFLNGTVRNLDRFRNFLDTYQRAYGQQVNLHKSQVFVGDGVPGARASQVLGMRLASSPIKYLSSYLYKGINPAAYCDSLLDHFDARLNSWSSKLLSMAGRLTLIQHVLCTMPIHIIASSKLPHSVIAAINRNMTHFLWNDRHHWHSWENICRQIQYGGMGIRNLSMLEKSYDCLIWLKFHHSNTLWATYTRSKYGQRNSIYSHSGQHILCKRTQMVCNGIMIQQADLL